MTRCSGWRGRGGQEHFLLQYDAADMWVGAAVITVEPAELA